MSLQSKMSLRVADLKSTYSVNSVPTYKGIDIPIDRKLNIRDIKQEALTKEEVKALIDSLGRITPYYPIII